MKIYLTNITEMDIKQLSPYVAWCDVERQHAIEKYCFEQDKKRGIVAGLLLRYAYRGYLLAQGKELHNQVVLAHHPHGKPYIKDDEAFHFSLSHAGEYVLLAWDENEIGADIEQVKEKKRILEMAKRFYTEKEYQQLRSLPDSVERERAFIRVWTQKESYIKFLGDGLKYGMDSFYVQSDGKVIDTKQEMEKDICIQEFDKLSEYCISVCYVKDKNVQNVGAFIEDIPIDILTKK